MSVTTLPTAEAPSVPRRLSLQTWLVTQAGRIDLDSPANAVHRTWLEGAAADAFTAAVEAFTAEVEGAFDQVVRDGHYATGGRLGVAFPADGFLSNPDMRAKAIRAALSSGCADVLAGEVGTA